MLQRYALEQAVLAQQNTTPETPQDDSLNNTVVCIYKGGVMDAELEAIGACSSWIVFICL